MSETDYNKIAVIIDVDDVLVDFVPHWLRWIEKTFKVRAEKAQITEWLLSECTPELAEIGEDRLCTAFGTPGFHRDAPPMPGAIEVVKRLDKDFRLYFVTARHGALGIQETFDWFKAHLPRVQHKQIVFSRTKDIFTADVVIDDKTDHLRAYIRAPHHGNSVIVGMAQPHNLRDREMNVDRWVTPDAKGWKDFEAIVREAGGESPSP